MTHIRPIGKKWLLIASAGGGIYALPNDIGWRNILLNGAFIFVYQLYAIKAFKVNSIDYLLKPIDELDQIEMILDTADFFRVSRGCIVNIKSVVKSSKYFDGRLKVTLHPQSPQEITVSRKRSDSFLKWLDGNI